MKCIILCAGKGTRMFPLTKDMPKCLLKYRGKTLLEYKLDAIPESVKEVFLVIGYLGNLILEKYGNDYRHFKIKYIQMSNLNGTGGAIELFNKYLNENEKFLVLMGDDIYGEEDLNEIINISESEDKLFIGIFRSDNIDGKPLFFDDEDNLVGFDTDSNLENTGVYVLNKNYFDLQPIYIKNDLEIGIPHTLCANSHKYKIKKFELRFWKKINRIKDLI